MRADLLDVIAIYSNPMRWENRRKCHAAFEQHMLDSGVRLTTVECAFGERPHELPDHQNINRVRLRANTVVWNKENLFNRGLSFLPANSKYIALIDADIFFRKKDWASEAVHALQHYDVIQPWSDAYDLGPHDEHLQHHKSFLCQWYNEQRMWPDKNGWKHYTFPHPGYAWCFRRDVLERIGGLFEVAAAGAGDHHMALALIGAWERSLPPGIHPSYRKHLEVWAARAMHHVGMNLGHLFGTIEHFWHGKKADRKYVDRWQIILKNGFDPDTDLKRNMDGVIELACNKARLRHDLDRYFRQRNEDSNSLS